MPTRAQLTCLERMCSVLWSMSQKKTVKLDFAITVGLNVFVTVIGGIQKKIL